MLTAEQVRQKSPEEVAQLFAQITKQFKQTNRLLIREQHAKADLEQDNTILRHKLNQLLLRQYGRQSEKDIDNPQTYLFDEATLPDEEQTTDIESSDEAISIIVPEHSRKKGRKPLPKHFTRVERIHDLRDDEKRC